MSWTIRLPVPSDPNQIKCGSQASWTVKHLSHFTRQLQRKSLTQTCECQPVKTLPCQFQTNILRRISLIYPTVSLNYHGRGKLSAIVAHRWQNW